MSTDHTQQEEVDRNFAFFQTELPKLLPEHQGQYALIRDQKIQSYFGTMVDAHVAGSQLFKDNAFSIQQVTNNAVDLGYFSHGMHLGFSQPK